MKADLVSGLVEGVRYVPSPNCDPRPDGVAPEVLIIHSISLPPGQFGGPGIGQLLQSPRSRGAPPYYQEIKDLQVSAHLLIRRGGEAIQFAPLHLRATIYAGQSCCEGRTRVNDFSIGIELEGTEDQPFESAQYQTLAELTRAIMRIYPAIVPERVYGHADIAPGRKGRQSRFRLAGLSYDVYIVATFVIRPLPKELRLDNFCRALLLPPASHAVVGHWALLADRIKARAARAEDGAGADHHFSAGIGYSYICRIRIRDRDQLHCPILLCRKQGGHA